MIFFLLFSLRVINWFEYPYVLISGDYRPPLIQEAFTKRIMYTWDETDFGMPSVYAPRILVPSYFFMTVFQAFGTSLYLAQMITLFLMCFLSSVLMFVFMKRLTNGNVVASFVAAVFMTSNLYMINDREITAIALLDETLVILPCLLAFFEGVERRSFKLMAFSGLLFVLVYGSFPNYRTALLCIVSLLIVLLFIVVNRGLSISYHRDKSSRPLDFSFDMNSIYHCLKGIFVFAASALLASVWILVTISTHFGAFFEAYRQMGIPQFILDVRLHDGLRLITKWGFYGGNLGAPYVPYADTYLHNPLIIVLSYLPPILAFTSLLASKSRKLAVYFSVIAVFFLLLASAFSPLPSQFYLTLATYIPFMIAFRESAQWSFLVVVSYSILIGITLSMLYNRFKAKQLRIIALGLVIVVLIASSYPLATGDISRNYMNTNVKGSFLPDSYAELNDALSDRYWALLLPQRYTYVAYNFSGIPLACGNPYPLIFSKPMISGLGTEYMQSQNLDLVNRVYDVIRSNGYENVALKGNGSASSVQEGGFAATQGIDGDSNTRWASSETIPQWFEIEWNKTQELSKVKIVFERAYANDYIVETWNGSNWATQVRVENNTDIEPEYVFSQLTPAERLRINFTKATHFGMVSIWELETYVKTEGFSKPLGVLGIRYLVLEKTLFSGNVYDISELKLDQNEDFILAKEWNEVALYDNTYALQKLYAADSLLNFTTPDDMFQTVMGSRWDILQHSVFLDPHSEDTLKNTSLAMPEDFVWSELSPTSYVVRAKSKGAFVLVFLESYDKNWKVCVNGDPVSEENHQEVNVFANGWLIDNAGELTITISYETQNLFMASVLASVIPSVLLLAFFSRAELITLTKSIRRRLGNKLKHRNISSHS